MFYYSISIFSLFSSIAHVSVFSEGKNLRSIQAKDVRITSAEMLFPDATTHCTMSTLGGFPAGACH